MMYLILEMLVLLGIAFLLGAFIGFVIGKMFCGTSAKKQKPEKKKNVKGKSKAAGAAIAVEPAVDTVLEPLSDDEMEFDIDDIAHDFSLEEPVKEADFIDLGTTVNLDEEGYAIETLEGIGPQTGDLLRGYGVATVGDYLRKLATSEQRMLAAQSLEILEPSLDKWAAMADLLRVVGIDHQFAELLVAGAVHSVADLGGYEAEGLATKLYEVNNAGSQLIAPISPPAEQIAGWITQAKTMTAVVTF